MRFIHNLIIASKARKDARLGFRQVEDTITASIGQKPSFSPESNPGHLQLSRAINVNAEVEELQDDLRVNENELAEGPSMTGMDALIALLFVCELLGSVLVMKAIGLQNPERLIFGAGLAAILFYLTTRLASNPSRVLFAVLLAAYAVIVIGIAVIRAESGGDEYTSNAVSFGEAVVMLATTIGPAWLFEHVWRRRAPMAVLARKARGLKRRLFQLRRSQRAAQRQVNKIAHDGSSWDAMHERFSAIYNSTYNRNTKHTGGESAVDSSSSTTLTRRPTPPERIVSNGSR